LPTELSSLVGRDPEIAAVRERLRGGRVVTLTGPGGCGKTRLALRVAALAEPGFDDGARLVELASLTDPALIPASVAEALGVPERDATNPMAGVVRALADRELLIVLDNCEHVLGSASRVVVMLAEQCRRVRILTTSRERLDVPGEFVFPVPPLELPEDGSVRAVAASEAGSLFVARARAASPAFALTAGNSAAIAATALRYAEGVMAWHRGELAGAEHLAREATVQWHRGSDRMDACDGIELLGVLAAARERFSDAARLLAAADAARRPLLYLAPGFTANRDAAAGAASQARQVLGDERFTQAWEQGQGLTLDDAVAYAARKGGGRKRPATGWASLIPAELEVVRLVGEGLRNDAIARRLFIAPGTVKVHLSHIFAKLGITTRAELAAQAASQDLTAR